MQKDRCLPFAASGAAASDPKIVERPIYPLLGDDGGVERGNPAAVLAVDVGGHALRKVTEKS